MSATVDMSVLLGYRRSVTRQQFVELFPSFFLLVGGQPLSDAGGYATTAATVRTRPSRKDATPFDAREIKKSASNPYSDRIAVGRARNCDIVFRDPSVSKLHAHFRVDASTGLMLADVGSQNGTSVNGIRMTARQPEPISVGDELSFGDVVATVVDAGHLWDLLR